MYRPRPTSYSPFYPCLGPGAAQILVDQPVASVFDRLQNRVALIDRTPSVFNLHIDPHSISLFPRLVSLFDQNPDDSRERAGLHTCTGSRAANVDEPPEMHTNSQICNGPLDPSKEFQKTGWRI